MVEANMQRTFLPLYAAIMLCDQVRPKGLADFAADYLAKTIPLYSSMPLLLKHSQNLEMHLVEGNKIPKEKCYELVKSTLEVLPTIKDSMKQFQEFGYLVRSFKRETVIPEIVMQDTNIAEVLNAIALCPNWKEYSQEIAELAEGIREEIEAE
ncbi:hypothetical protein M422DRAFT_28809 [Sphaerobolus stellatus SS14]|nr:hypothetical protein M422DRAFT_28809 [Sphaerobolus stellatus SS14]